MIATVGVLPIRAGELPVGGRDVVAEAGGRCWLIGDDPVAAAKELGAAATALWTVDGGTFAPNRWADGLAPLLPADEHILLPHSTDGRDLAPRLAVALDRPLVSGAVRLDDDVAVVSRRGGLVMETLRLGRPCVATLQPDVRGIETSGADSSAPAVTAVRLAAAPDAIDPEQLAEREADPATMDLAEAPRIVGGGAGLGSDDSFARLHDLAASLDASVGATRVVTDWGWAPVDRQIGTTGVIVDPDLYLAVGISGAIQHAAGLGTPDHVITVNTDPSCPMMDLADLAIVCDGPAFVAALQALLDERRQP